MDTDVVNAVQITVCCAFITRRLRNFNKQFKIHMHTQNNCLSVPSI